MNVAIIGSRDFTNYELLTQFIDNLDLKIDTIVSGGARGADTLGKVYALDRNIPLIIHYPEWDKYGKKAGFLRNTTIIESSDIVIAFWDGVSNGTRDSLLKARKLGKIMHICRYDRIVNEE